MGGEIFLVELPSARVQEGEDVTVLQAVVDGTSPDRIQTPLHDPATAEVIRRTVRLAEWADQEPLIMADLFDNGSIPRRHLPGLKGVLEGADIFDQEDLARLVGAGQIEVTDGQVMQQAAKDMENTGLTLLDMRGNVCQADAEGNIAPEIWSDVTRAFESNTPEAHMASAKGLTHFRFKHPVAFSREENGLLVPTVYACTNTILGTVDSSGIFQQGGIVFQEGCGKLPSDSL